MKTQKQKTIENMILNLFILTGCCKDSKNKLKDAKNKYDNANYMMKISIENLKNWKRWAEQQKHFEDFKTALKKSETYMYIKEFVKY